MTGIAPINPAEYMSDIVIKEGSYSVPETEEQKIAQFNQLLVEELFLKGIFNTEHSIYKPDNEDSEALFSPKTHLAYQTYAKSLMAENLVEQGMLNNIVVD